MSTRVLPGCQTFEAQRGPDGKVRAGVWDRVCVPGSDEKDGQHTEFSLKTLGQMVDNFVARGDLIAIDYNHQSNYAHLNGQPAPALGFYGALAIVHDGRIVKMGTVKDVRASGSEPGLDLARDGLWAYRSDVTELGDQLLMNFRLLSPTFTSEGTERDGTPVGYSLAAVAATNTPWQSGTEITFAKVSQNDVKTGDKIRVNNDWLKVINVSSIGAQVKENGRAYFIDWNNIDEVMKMDAIVRMARDGGGAELNPGDLVWVKGKEYATVVSISGGQVGIRNKQGVETTVGESEIMKMLENGATAPSTKGVKMSTKLAKFAGLDEGADEAAIKQAVSAKTAALAKAALEEEGFKHEEAAKELEEAAAECENDVGVAMQRMAKSFRKMAAFDAKDDDDEEQKKKKKEKDEGDGKPFSKLEDDEEKKKMADEMEDGAAAKMAVMQATINAQQSQLAKLVSAEAERAKEAQRAREQQFEQLADQAIAGGYPSESRGALLKFARTDFAGARAAVAHFIPKTNAPLHLFDRASRQGAPIGGDTSAREFAGPMKPRIVRAMGRNFVEDDSHFADEIKRVAESKDPVLMSKVDKYLPESQRPVMFNRLIAAEKIIRAERPDLAEQGE